VYVDYVQQADTTLDASSLIIRGPVSLQPRIEHIITSLNHDTAVNFESMDALISGSITRERFQTTLLATFAAVALLLALTGIYGLLSYTVARRTSEIGVRMALGASASLILRLILGEAGRLVFLGLAIGLAASLIAARLLQAMLYQVRPNDPMVLFAVAGAFLVAATLASCLPALRAAHVSPSEALRSE
jgi:ABC-type antimicrobial peptide transport system permease subunit